MKTGRLLKFHRAAAEVHACLYRDGGCFRAAVYVMSTDPAQRNEPVQSLSGPSEHAVEAAARDWIDARYPKP